VRRYGHRQVWSGLHRHGLALHCVQRQNGWPARSA
jgi:hypothetical protein